MIDSGDGAPIRGIDIPPLPVSSLEEETLTEPSVRPAVAGPVVEGRKVEILKSIVYGGLIEAKFQFIAVLLLLPISVLV